MKMDIATPAELVRFEQACIGENRLGYLTFLNESIHPITALSGRLLLLDEHGGNLDSDRVSFGQMLAAPGAFFTCHLPLDDYPAFASATMVVEDVLFDGEEPWALHPTRLREYAVPALPEGPARHALIAVAGPDAICHAARHGSSWLCVCGRFNRWRWSSCRRCRRGRDETLHAFTPENTEAAYRAHLDKARQEPQRVLVSGKARKKTPASEAREKMSSGKIDKRVFRWITGIAALVVTVLLLLWLVSILRTPKAQPADSPSPAAATSTGTPVPSYEPDYLYPVN